MKVALKNSLVLGFAVATAVVCLAIQPPSSQPVSSPSTSSSPASRPTTTTTSRPVDPKKMAEAVVEINKISNLVETFNVKMKRYPSQELGLKELAAAPEDATEAEMWKKFGPLIRELPTDPWGRPLVYKLNEREGDTTFRVYSVGPDGIDGTDDDVTGATRSASDK